MPIRTFLIAFICLFGLFSHAVLEWGVPVVWAGEPRVSVVLSSEIRPYIQAMDGLKSAFPSYIHILSMANPELVAEQLKFNDYERIVAVGSNAAKLVLKNVSDNKKVVVLMVLDIQENLGDAVCGVDMRVPIEEQLRLISGQLGGNLRIAVLFSTQENAKRVKEAEQAAQKMGLQLIPWQVSERSKASELLNTEAVRIDCLLFLPDPIFDSETFIAHLVKTALLTGVAPIGYNRFFVETGAVLSFNLDYMGIGRQGAAFLNDPGMCRILSPVFQVEFNEKGLELVRKQRGKRQ